MAWRLPARGVYGKIVFPLRHDPADPAWPDRDRIAEDLPAALGMALAERLLAARFGRSLVDHRTWALVDGARLAEGAWLEAAEAVGRLSLERLCVVAEGAPAGAVARFGALGWAAREAPPERLAPALAAALRARRPTLIVVPAGAASLPAGPGEPGRGAAARRAWLKRLARHPGRAGFERAMAGLVPLEGASARGTAASPAAYVLEALARLAPDWAQRPPLPAQARAGTVLGFARHGGVLAASVQPMAELAAFQPALREAAAERLPVVVGFVEPESACPVGGQRAALRAMVGLTVWRPAGVEEARTALALAVREPGPAVLLLHDGPGLALEGDAGRGGYVAAEGRGGRDLTLIASGAELAVALAARDGLARAGLRAAVVSLPCWERFAREPDVYRRAVLGGVPRFGLEAGGGFGWERWLGPEGVFVGPDAAGVLSAALVETTVLARISARPLVAAGRFA